MSAWVSVREQIHRFIQWAQTDPTVRAAAKVALEQIPVVGEPLAAIYGEVTKGEANEDAKALLMEVLARVEAIGESGLDDVGAHLRAIAASQEGGLAKLRAAAVGVDRLQGEIQATRNQLREVNEALDRVEADLEALAWGSMEFALDSPADRVAFLVQLSGLLGRSQTIFTEQLSFARSLVAEVEIPRAVKDELSGLDDRLWWASHHEKFNTGASWRMFGELRRITHHMREVNLRVRWLIRSHRDLLPSAFPADALDEHLSLWLAKYAYMRRAYGDEFCLIFVGAEPTGVPFPEGVDGAIETALAEALRDARLDHIASMD